MTLESRIMPGCVGGSRRDHRRGRAKVHRRRGLWASRRCSIEDKVLRGCRFDLESDYISFFRNSGVNPLFVILRSIFHVISPQFPTIWVSQEGADFSAHRIYGNRCEQREFFGFK